MRYELTDHEWTAIRPMLPNKPRGVPRVNDRRVATRYDKSSQPTILPSFSLHQSDFGCALMSPRPREQRATELRARFAEWARITREARLPDDRLYIAALAAFTFVRLFALTSKHPGFSEEQEWRAIYFPERDPQQYFKDQLDYFVGPRGIESKLKMKLGESL